MSKKYRSRNGSLHTYEFYKERRDDPSWEDDFLRIRAIRQRNFLIAIVAVIAVVIIGGFIYEEGQKGKSQNTAVESSSSSSTASSKSKVSESSSSESSKVEQSSKPTENKTSNNAEQIKKFLIGKTYKVVPFLYDGINANQAAHTNKAPQNFVKDNITILHFIDSSTVTQNGVNGNNQQKNENYQTSDSTITIGALKIPYQMNNGAAEFHSWNTEDQNGHKVTWKIEPYHENNNQDEDHHDHNNDDDHHH